MEHIFITAFQAIFIAIGLFSIGCLIGDLKQVAREYKNLKR
jgi:hypothetical protein